VRLDDNTGEASSTMTQLVYDALRVTRLDPPAGSDAGPIASDGGVPADAAQPDAELPDAELPDADGGTRGGLSSGCGCRAGGGGGSPSSLLLFLALALVARRRRA
jgi:MYXO-CTERM domain-containing protein